MLVGACSQPSTNAAASAAEPDKAQADREALVLWTTDTAGTDLDVSGPIQGKLKSSAPPEISATVLADRLLRCGVTTYTIQVASHVEYVFTDSSRNDLDLVKCVQDKVDFGFAAGVGKPGKLEEADQSPFKALHA